MGNVKMIFFSVIDEKEGPNIFTTILANLLHDETHECLSDYSTANHFGLSELSSKNLAKFVSINH